MQVAYADSVTNDLAGIGRIGRLWVVATVMYGALRVVLAATFVADYGLNIVAFAIIELVSSLALGITTARLAIALKNRRRGGRAWLFAAVVLSYFAPDAYVLVFAGRMPGRVLVPVLVIVCIGAVSGVLRLRRFRSGATSGS